MKKQVLSFAIAFSALAAHAQNQSVGIGTISPNPAAILDISSPNKGVLLPRIALSSSKDSTSIVNPPTGLMVINTNPNLPVGEGFYYNSGTPSAPSWARVPGLKADVTPAPGQAIVWNGTNYEPGNPPIFTSGGPITGDGTAAHPITINPANAIFNANSLNGEPLSTTNPTSGQTLVWNGSQWVPQNIPGDNWGTQSASVSSATLSGNGTSGSPLSANNTSAIWNANQLNGKPVDFTTAPTNGQTIVYNSATGKFVPGVTAGDNWGTQSVQLTGNGLTGAGTVASPLTFSGVATSGTAVSGLGTTASPLTVNSGTALFNANKINGTAVSATAPTITGQVLIYNATTGTYAPGTIAGDNWGTQVAAISGAAISGNGSSASPLSVNNTSPIFNANQINTKAVDFTTAPVSGQSLVYDGTKFVPGIPGVVTGGLLTGNGSANSPVMFNGVNTASGSPITGVGSPGSPLDINTASPVYNANKVQGKSVSSTAPTTGQVLQFDGTQYTPTTLTGDNWGSQSAAVSATTMTGNGTSGSPLAANNTSAIWNANQINGKAVDFTTAPTNGQTIVYNSSTGKFVPGASGDNWGSQSVALTAGTQLTGAGTTASPLAFSGVATTGAAVSGVGTTASPLSINNGSAIFNANKINSTGISATAPTTGQALIFDGTNYTPTSLTVTTGAGLSGSGTAASPLVFTGVTTSGAALTGAGTAASPLTVNNSQAIFNSNALQGKAISTTAPTNGQVLVYNSSLATYVPGTPASDNWGTQSAVVNATTLAGNGTSASPLTANNTSAIWNANQINGKAVSATAPTAGQTLVFDGTSYTPTTATDTWGTQSAAVSATTLSGNGTSASPLSVKNTTAIWNANQINGKTVSATAPTAGQTLVFDGTNYTPTTTTDTWGTQSAAINATTMSGNGTSASPLAANNTAAIWNANQINGKAVDFTTAPTNGQTLVYNSTTGKFIPGAAAADNWGSQSVVVSTANTALSGAGTTASPLLVNTGNAIFNANKLNNISIVGAPVSGQTLVYDGTNYVPKAMIDSTTASNGLTLSASNDIALGGSLTTATTIGLGNNNLTFSTTGTGRVALSAPSDPLKLTGVQAVSTTDNYKPVVLASDGTLKTVATVNKYIMLSSTVNQHLTASTFNSGTQTKLDFLATEVNANVGGIYSFNATTDEITVSEAGTYVIDGYSGYVSNDDASNGSANSNISYPWAQGVNLSINKNGTIMDGTRMIYTSEMAHTASGSTGYNFIATISAHTILVLNAGDKITLSIQKALGNDAADPWIMVPTGLTTSKKFTITRM